jgi:hypothetical protein
MPATRLPLTLELTTPVLLAGDLADAGQYDPRTQTCGSHTQSKTSCKSVNYGSGIVVDVVVDITIDDNG